MSVTHQAMDMPAHPDEPVLQSEHEAAMNLTPVAEATHVARVSGSWSASSTWRDGRIPVDGSRVLIPKGLSVEVDAVFPEALEWIRVNGDLHFAPNVDTQLRVDTLVTAPGSRLEIGTADHPVQPDVTAQVVFVDRGPLDPEDDPMLLGRGAILHGSTIVHGSKRTSALRAVEDPRRGDREILLNSEPQGWKTGDRLVIAGTRSDGTGDETVRIQAIDGRRILLDQPLSEDHSTPRDHLDVHVANLTRNVVFVSESDEIDRRGHVMFMHTRDVDVANAAFNDLGRTDKSRPLDNPYFDDEGFFVEETGGNAGGRYSVHFHRNGTNRDGTPSVVRGSVVAGNPGWGYVNHSSYVDFIDNVAFDVSGAAFSTEAGDEIGRFQDNFAIRMHGTGEEPILRQEEGDFGHAGDGFWLQGPGVQVDGNVATGATGSGLILYAEPLFEDGLGITTFASSNLPDPGLAGPAASVPVSLAPLASFRGNESYGSALGAQIYYHRTFITIEEEQEEQAGLRFPQSLVEDMDLWSNANGMLVNYTVDTDFRDLRIIGPVDGSGDTGFNAASNFYNRGTHHYADLQIEDYEIGFAAPRSGLIQVEGGYFNNITDFYLNEPRQLGRRISFTGDIRFGDRVNGVVEGEVIPRSYFEMDPEFAPAADSANEHFLLDDQVLLDFGAYQNQQLYFYEQAPEHIIFPEPPDQLTPDDPGPTVGQEFVGVTNAEIHAGLGSSFGGALLPDDAAEYERILGLIGSPVLDLPPLDPNPLPGDEDPEDDEDLDDDSPLLSDGAELEFGLDEAGGQSRLKLDGELLSVRSGGSQNLPLDDVDIVSLFCSDQDDVIKVRVHGNPPSSRIELVSLYAGAGDDRIQLRSRGDELPQVLELLGDANDDEINARRYGGDLVIEGGSGDDILVGGRGSTELWGGEGEDEFHLRNRSGLQSFMDFQPGEDDLVMRMGSRKNLMIENDGDDLWLLKKGDPVAVFVGLSQQEDAIAALIG